MKALVFGYSNGIGQAIYNTCKKNKFNVVGIGLEDGVDINNEEQRKQVVLASKDCDVVFIVPAGRQNRFSQCDMLGELFQEYQHHYKKIVMIGGSSPDTRNKNEKQLNKHLYDASKIALDHLANKLNGLNDPCQIILIRPGRVNSNHNIGSTQPLIDPYKLAENILKIVEMSTEMRIISTTIIQDAHTGINGKCK